MSFLFLFKKTTLFWDEAKTKNCSYKTAIYTHCYDTSGTKLVDTNKLDFNGNYLFISVTEPGIALYVFSVPFQKHKIILA